MEKLDYFASICNVTVLVSESFWLVRENDGYIYEPLIKSNHYVGRSLNVNFILQNGDFCDTDCIKALRKGRNEVACFVQKVT